MTTTNANEYYSNIHQINSYNRPTIAVLTPSSEKIYGINLNERTIEAPDFLSVEQDHTAETVFFKVDRYFDNVDLSNTSCVIYYTNAKGDSYIYQVPYYDIYTLADDESGPKILFPWCIDGYATIKPGIIEFSIQFFALNDKKELTYCLNTQSAKSKILYGLKVELNDNYYNLTADFYQEILSKINDINLRQDIYWELV